ncbi:uncharacterized protein [Anser cygnoides]|uniref:uncharacterized protein n=1 Tax=Anser cygnoides TaxID=8845 RepID=UPI0034D2602E
MGDGKKATLQASQQDGCGRPFSYFEARRPGREYGAGRVLLRCCQWDLMVTSLGTVVLCQLSWGGASTSIGSSGGGSTSMGSSSGGGSTSMASTSRVAAQGTALLPQAPVLLCFLVTSCGRILFSLRNESSLDPCKDGQPLPQVLFLPSMMGIVRGLEAQRVAGPAQGPFIGLGTIRGAGATVTSASLCDGGQRMAKRGCCWERCLWPERRPHEEGGGSGGRGPLSWGWLSLAIIDCQRDRLPLGHRACPPAPSSSYAWAPCATRWWQQCFRRGRASTTPCHRPGCLQVVQPPMLTAAERGQSTQTSCRLAMEARPGSARSPSSQ